MTDLLPRAAPESQGVPPEALDRLTGALDALGGTHTLMVLRRGDVIAETTWHPYERGSAHALYSVSKSFTAVAVGLAIDEGAFGLDDTVLDLLPGAAPQHPSSRLSAMRVRHLLTMSTGHETEPEFDGGDWARETLAVDTQLEPGSRFVYNTAATYLLSEIVQRTTGSTLTEYLWPRLFEPLGFARPFWLQSPTGVDAGGFGLMLRPEELAVFGELLRAGGVWRGRRLVSAEWIAAATSKQIANRSDDDDGDWAQGYGFQFWRCRHGAYRADGAFGQFVVIMPEQECVVVVTGGTADMGAVLDAIWQVLLPALGPGDPGDPGGPGASPIPSAAPRRSIPTPGGERVAGDVEYAYAGPIARLRLAPGAMWVDGVRFDCEPDRWSTGALTVTDADGYPAWFGDRVAIAGGKHGDEIRIDVRPLQDAPTFTLRIGASGRLTITQDVGFDGPDVWQGDPLDPQASDDSARAHQSTVSP
ncbi:CubicO group peptidase (beta-lactamase class C family) [Microbacterium terrae]|uniref:Penicillin-binding protein 4 n=1 Tax=Microbacterium terrae TaxID=69369 RepID=A0A0M2H575_9MICO|nr:serine hydrolase [Microbacterium terrae]KJL38939.1 Penicillin-binding protein 4* [Microbacterium terrae]MBP1077121.1 CubicO group peptidase (beta-lactamase class C family) [Microbacterium terrae]GLJ99715.1 hypothetical protein GCM10017594_29130 [Microbacterium terrae]